MRTRTVWGPRPQFVRESRELLGEAPQYDVIVCGGTLGIFLACSLQLQGAPGGAFRAQLPHAGDCCLRLLPAPAPAPDPAPSRRCAPPRSRGTQACAWLWWSVARWLAAPRSGTSAGRSCGSWWVLDGAWCLCAGARGLCELRGAGTAASVDVVVHPRQPSQPHTPLFLHTQVELGVFSEAEAADCVSVEFNPVRVGFYGEKGAGAEVWTRDGEHHGACACVLGCWAAGPGQVVCAECVSCGVGLPCLSQTSLRLHPSPPCSAEPGCVARTPGGCGAGAV